MSFDKQLQKRIDYDNKVMEAAFDDLASVLGIEKSSNLATQTFDSEEVQQALDSIFAFLAVEVPKVPPDVIDFNARLEYMCRPSGVMTRRVELEGKWWLDSHGPLLGSTESGTTVAILPGRFSGYVFFDPELGKKIRVNPKTAPKLAKDAYLFYQALPSRELGLLDLSLFILRSLTARDVLFIVGISLLVSLLGMFIPFMNKQIFDNVIPSGTKGDLWSVAILMVGATFGASLFTMARTLVLMRLRDKVNIAVQNAAIARMFTLPVSFFKDYSAGEISERAMSINALSNMLSDTVLTSGLAALFSFVYIFQMANFASVLVVPALLSILAVLVFTIFSGFARQQIFRKQSKLQAKLSGFIYNLLGGVQKIKLAGAEKRAFARWAARYREVGRLTYAPPLFLRLNEAISGALFLGGALFLYYFAGKSQIAPADYIAFNIAYGTVSGAILALGGVVLTFANVKPLLEMVEPILKAAPEVDENKIQVTALSGQIEISNVSFSYTESGPLVLNKLNLKVEPGEFLAVVGKSGCGKSTLMRLLLGFEEPDSGAIYYDGYDLRTLDLRSVRQCIGVDLQNGKLFSGDIFSNIIITAPWSNLDDAWEAACLAGIDEDIRQMPMGMHTMISEGSGGISGGQKQRILIARALITKPKILLFDEATSALDNITQQHVATSLASLGCTRIIIAHRLSTVKECHRIVVIDQGKIAEEGTYEELMAREGLFYDFAARQIA